jgi:hypothetical protein
MSVNGKKVVVNFISTKRYPEKVPFNPHEKYPEYSGDSPDHDNFVYAGVRDSLCKLGS